MAHSTMNDSGQKSFTATAVAISAFRRVTVDSAGLIAVSGAANDAIGITLRDIAASGTGPVKLFSASGTFTFTASAAITRGAKLYPTAAGKVDDAGTTGGPIGFVALEAATADGDNIEAAPQDTGSALGTLGDGENIAVGTVTGTKLATAAAQKLGFWNATPVVQPASANQTAVTDNTGGSVADAIAADGFTQGAAFTDNTTGAASTTLAAGAGVETIAIPIQLAAIAGAGDVLTNYTPGYKFKILAVNFAVSTAVTTAAKAAALNLEIGAVDVTGGVVSLTSALCTPLGALVAGTAVTAANTGSATDTISVEAAAVTAFVEGQGYLLLRLQNMDTADAFASLAAQRNLARTDATTQNDNDAKILELVNQLRSELVTTGLIKGSA